MGTVVPESGHVVGCSGLRRTLGLFVWLVPDGWYSFVLREKYCWLVADSWFDPREKYCCLVAPGSMEFCRGPLQHESFDGPLILGVEMKSPIYVLALHTCRVRLKNHMPSCCTFTF
jgi:hypothetical protein